MDDCLVINRVLIVGLGSMGKRHLLLARELIPDADIRVLRHQASNTVPEYADSCFSSIEQAINFSPQIAVIANPATFHMSVAEPLAWAGAHLLIEKPLSASSDDVPPLLKACLEQQTVLLTGYNLRFTPSLQKFRDLINKNVIGKVLSVRCEVGQYLPSWRPGTDYRKSVSSRRELGGGALLELSHEIDFLGWIFGEVEWVKATLSRQSNLEIDVEDTAHLILGFVPAADGHRIVATMNLDFIRQDTTRLCTVIGANGSLRWNGLTGVVEQFEAGANDWKELLRDQHHRDESYRAEWLHFLSCLTDNTPLLINGEDGARVLKIIDAARKASESGEQVHLAKRETKKR